MHRIMAAAIMLFAAPAWAQQGSPLTSSDRTELQGSCPAEAQALAARQPRNTVFSQQMEAFEYGYGPPTMADTAMLNALNRRIERNLSDIASRRLDQFWGAYENCLIRVRIGQIQRRLGMAAAAARPALPPPATAPGPGKLPPLPASATPVHDCVEPGVNGTTGVLRNKCDFKIMVSMCVVGPPAATAYAYNDCAEGKWGGYDIGAHGMQAAIYRKATNLYWFACRMPLLPQRLHFEPGRGLIGVCQ